MNRRARITDSPHPVKRGSTRETLGDSGPRTGGDRPQAAKNDVPPRWGSTQDVYHTNTWQYTAPAVPAHVGIDPETSTSRLKPIDDQTPRTRGSTVAIWHVPFDRQPHPARAGMNPKAETTTKIDARDPRTRGGRQSVCRPSADTNALPRVRGSTAYTPTA